MGWFGELRKNNAILGGLIYLRDISQDRFAIPARRNLDRFNSICGEDALSRVVMVTTRWDREGGMDFGARERELSTKHWAS